MKEFLKRRETVFVCRILLGVLFIVAGGMKVTDPSAMKEAVAAYNVVPDAFVPLIAVVLPWLELLCGVMLILNMFSRSVALIFTVLIIGFMYGVGLNMYRGVEMECGCFDVLYKQSIGWGVQFRDLGFLLLALPILFFGENTLLPTMSFPLHLSFPRKRESK